MNLQTGRFVGGVIIVDNPEDFVEGERVTILTEPAEGDTVEVTREEEEELLERIEECKRGEVITSEQLFAELEAERTQASDP